MMNTGASQGSARIYQFPTGGRAALGGRRYGEAKAEFAARRPTSRLAATVGTTLPRSRTKRAGVTIDGRETLDRDAPDQ